MRRIRRRGRILCTALAAAFFLSVAALAPAPAQAQTPRFPDVPESLPSYSAIQFLSEAGIISGYKSGMFGPDDTLKRAQATKMLVLWKQVPLQQGGSPFPDVDATYCSYIETASQQGWITGFPDGRFKPYSNLNRQQMAIIMVRAMGWEDAAEDMSGEQVDEILSAFSDQADINSVARRYVAKAVSEGLFGGSHGRFSPVDPITRGQFCLVVLRAELKLRAVIQGIRTAPDYADRTRVVIDLSQQPGTVTASVAPDGNLTIDYQNGSIGEALVAPVQSLEVSAVTARQFAYDPRTVRISVDTVRFQGFRIMSLAPAEGFGYRIVVDVYRRTSGPDGDGPPLLCIDPGHGGTDPGALGVGGVQEKDVNLCISKYVVADLQKAGIRTMMTREADTYPTLDERSAMANAAKATLFVSIHNNATDDPDGNGTETFFWGTPELYSPEGKLLAEAIQRNLLAAIQSYDRGAKTHWINLAVLANTEMTAALVEVGFVTNATEVAKLITPEYQQAAAQGITAGILEYLKWSTTVYTSES